MPENLFFEKLNCEYSFITNIPSALQTLESQRKYLMSLVAAKNKIAIEYLFELERVIKNLSTSLLFSVKQYAAIICLKIKELNRNT